VQRPSVESAPRRRPPRLDLVAGGWTNGEIADESHISISTVKAHLASLMRKLNARNRVEVAIRAYETGRITT